MKTNGAFSIFLVDDDKMFLRSLEHHLQQKLKHSVNIKSFPTGEECLKEMGKQKPNIVVLDYLLNGNYMYAMDGMSVLQKIKQAEPDTTVIMLSAQERMDLAIDVMKYGAYDYVIKNDNTLYKTQNAIRNAIFSISLAKKNKVYKLLIQLIFIIIAVIFGTVLIIRLAS